MFENLVVLPSDFARCYPKMPDYPNKKEDLKEFLLQNYPYKFIQDIIYEAYANDDDDICYVLDSIEVLLNIDSAEVKNIVIKFDYSFIVSLDFGTMSDLYKYLHKHNLFSLLGRLAAKYPSAYCKDFEKFPEYMQNIP